MENPDYKDSLILPVYGDLRFVKRPHPADARSDIRILQRFEWSYSLSDSGWFDVSLAEEAE